MICWWRADQLFAEAEASADNRPLPTSKNPHFQNVAKCTTFLVKMSFICVRMNTHFHIKGWALNLVLMQRPGESRKWPIDLRDTDKSRYFAKTEFNNCFIIRLSNLFFNEYLAFCHFHARAVARGRKAWFHLRMSRILFAAKQSWTALYTRRPLFVFSCICIRPMKRKNNLHRMIISLVYILKYQVT